MERNQLKAVTVEDVMGVRPCYSRAEVERLFAGRETLTAADVAALEIPAEDRIWALLHIFMDARKQRLFGVWCARQALALVPNPDPRSVEACNVAERYANGEADQDELEAAHDAAHDAALGTARIRTVREAAWAATWCTAWGAAVAWGTGDDAAWAATGTATGAIARNKEWEAARDAQLKAALAIITADR